MCVYIRLDVPFKKVYSNASDLMGKPRNSDAPYSL